MTKTSKTAVPYTSACAHVACLLALIMVLPLCGCDEKSFGPPRQATRQENAEAAKTQPAPSEPMLTVGNTQMPMPVPTGLKRIPHDHQLMRSVQTTMGSAETLLCLFEKTGEAAAPDQTAQNIARRDNLRVSTLTKWLNVSISSLDFLKMIQPWQEQSVTFNQNTFTFFEEAASARLLAEKEFTYNLGLVDSSPLHISFLKIVKHTGPTGQPEYSCITASVLWRHGKVLNITYTRHIDNFDQIQAVVAESISYLNKILALDRGAGEGAKQ